MRYLGKKKDQILARNALGSVEAMEETKIEKKYRELLAANTRNREARWAAEAEASALRKILAAKYAEEDLAAVAVAVAEATLADKGGGGM